MQRHTTGRLCHRVRRLVNQAFLTRIYIDEDEETRERTISVDCNEPFGNLLSRIVPAYVHHRLENSPTGQTAGGTPEVYSDGVHEGQGSHASTLVGLRILTGCWVHRTMIEFSTRQFGLPA